MNAITQSGIINVQNEVRSFDNSAGTDTAITLTNAANDFQGTVNITATDAGSDVTITDANAIELGSMDVESKLLH